MESVKKEWKQKGHVEYTRNHNGLISNYRVRENELYEANEGNVKRKSQHL